MRWNMKSISKAAAGVKVSATVAVDTRAKQMKAEGLNVLSFAAGEPDFNTPQHVKQAGIQAIIDNHTRYTPAVGMLPLKQAVAARIKEDWGAEYSVDEIVVSSGAKHVVFLALAALIDPGDEVIVPTPCWPSYFEMVSMLHGVSVPVYGDEAHGFKISPRQLEAAITDKKTKAIMLNNPSNPSGMLYSKAELEELCRVCVEHDLYIISDEVYYKLVYEGAEFCSVSALGEKVKERSIVIAGVSKSYCMTGWRIGYSAAPLPIAKAMASYASNSTGSPSTISQYAALTALNGPQSFVDDMLREYKARRDYMHARINAIDGLSCIMPQGAFYVMMNIEKLIGKRLCGRIINSDMDFASAFLESCLVAVVPCAGFGIDNFIRWSYAASMEDIEKGMDLLEKFVTDCE